MVIVRAGSSLPATNTYAIKDCNHRDSRDDKGLSTLVIDPSQRSAS
jgi:hypothetical protein